MKRLYDCVVLKEENSTRIIVNKNMKVSFVRKERTDEVSSDPRTITFVYDDSGLVDIMWEPVLFTIGLLDKTNTLLLAYPNEDDPETITKFQDTFIRYASTHQFWDMYVVYAKNFKQKQIENESNNSNIY